MDYSTEYQQYQQYYQQYQQQQPLAAAAAATEAYDPSQTQAYYAYNQQQQQYQYYPSQAYATTAYPQQFHQEPTSVHSSGVPIPSDLTHLQNHQNAYYSHGIADNLSQQQSNLTQFSDAAQRSVQQPQIGQSAYWSADRKGGRPFRGGSRPVGRGRGRGGGKHLLHGAASNPAPLASVPGQTPSTVPGQMPAAPSWPPPCMAWCELCRVDCNTPEILEQHKNGKRHKKNLQTHADLQNLNKKLTGLVNVQMPITGSQPEVFQPKKVEGSGEKQPPQEILASQPLIGNACNEIELQKNMVDSAEEAQRKSGNQFGPRGRGFKRKMRGGRGGKYMRTNEGPIRPVEPPKPKEAIPFICELCNVKCESQVVFDSHLAGKKHLANVKRFHGHRALYGEAGLQALYPPNFNAPSSSVIPHVQQGITDPQVVLAQLLTYVLSQAQAPGLLAAQIPGLLAAQMPGVAGMVAPAPVPAPASSQETHYQHDFHTQDNLVIAPLEEPDMNAEQDLPPTASENAASTSKCEVGSADKSVQQQLGNDLDDPVLENKENVPGSENAEDSALEIEENPEEYTDEAPQLQSKESSE